MMLSEEAFRLLLCEHEIVQKAIEGGGKHAMDKQDQGFMYAWSFYDLNGHHWQVMWMDPAAAQ